MAKTSDQPKKIIKDEGKKSCKCVSCDYEYPAPLGKSCSLLKCPQCGGGMVTV